MAVIDNTTPGDTSAVSSFPANERNMRTQVKNWIAVEHDEDTGYHKIENGNSTVRDAIADKLANGQLFIRTDTNTLEATILDTWTEIGAPNQIPTGGVTHMVFLQAAKPDGWTLVTTNKDRIPLFTDNTGVASPGEETGGTQGGTWTINSITVDGTELSQTQMPRHSHYLLRVSDTAVFDTGDWLSGTQSAGAGPATGGGDGTSELDEDDTISTRASGGLLGKDAANLTLSQADAAGVSHTHTTTVAATWRPNYVSVIECTKD